MILLPDGRVVTLGPDQELVAGWPVSSGVAEALRGEPDRTMFEWVAVLNHVPMERLEALYGALHPPPAPVVRLDEDEDEDAA
jgi:hypothetical protein